MTDHDYFHLITRTTIGCIAELLGIVYSTREWGDFRAWLYSLYKAMKKDIKISVQKFGARRPAMATLRTPERRQNRLIWSRRHARWTQRNWNQVMFSDESRFCSSKPDGRERVWRRRGLVNVMRSAAYASAIAGEEQVSWCGLESH